MFNSSIFVKKMWALKKWCVTKVAHCIIDSIDPSVILRSINKIGIFLQWKILYHYTCVTDTIYIILV